MPGRIGTDDLFLSHKYPIRKYKALLHHAVYFNSNVFSFKNAIIYLNQKKKLNIF